jgi:hypothetical protein
LRRGFGVGCGVGRRCDFAIVRIGGHTVDRFVDIAWDSDEDLELEVALVVQQSIPEQLF